MSIFIGKDLFNAEKIQIVVSPLSFVVFKLAIPLNLLSHIQSYLEYFF